MCAIHFAWRSRKNGLYVDYVLFQRETQILEDSVMIAEEEVRGTEERNLGGHTPRDHHP